MLNCKAVAILTHIKYGTKAILTIFACGQIATIAQTIVISTSKITTKAKALFFKPNWTGVNKKLKIKFNQNGKATINVILFWTNKYIM